MRCVKGIDDNLKILFDYLKAEDLWDNTIIIYTGDQGMMLGEHDYQDKRWMYEESMRMPFIMHYPELISEGRRSDLLINNTDFAPTLIELAGGTVPSYMQGKSFMKTVKGEEQGQWRKGTYYRYWMHLVHHDIPAHFGIRTKEYKLIFYYGRHYKTWKYGTKSLPWLNNSNLIERTPVAWEFYDLRTDPQELNNQYENPAYANIILELKDEILAQRAEHGETDGTKYPEIQQVIDDYWNVGNLSTETLETSNILELFPNPVENTVSLKLTNNTLLENISVKLYNALGQKFNVMLLNHNTLSNTAEFDMSPYKTGIYFVSISDGNSKQLERIVKL
ncbi:MAG: sulfatase/phosphatase domain-containing protein [Jejuia sp.]